MFVHDGITKTLSAIITQEGIIEVTGEQLASGEVAAKLAPAFRQTVGTDAYPTLDATKAVVAAITGAGYATLYVDGSEALTKEDGSWDIRGE